MIKLAREQILLLHAGYANVLSGGSVIGSIDSFMGGEKYGKH